MCFYDVTHCTNSILSRIHVNTTYLLNSTGTLVATCVILGRLEYTTMHGQIDAILYLMLATIDFF